MTQQDENQTSSDVRLFYAELASRLETERQGQETQDQHLSRLRGLSFLLAIGTSLYGLFTPGLAIGLAVAASWLVFLVLVFRHAVVATSLFHIQRRERLCAQARARIAGTYRTAKGEDYRRGDDFRATEHPYARDLDLFGPNSLFEQLNTAYTRGGEARLASWLAKAASPQQTAQRQTAAQELARLPTLREKLALSAQRARNSDRDATTFLAWARVSPSVKLERLIPAGAILLLVSLGFMVGAALLGGIWTKLWLASVAAQTLMLWAVRSQLEEILGPVCVKQSPLGRFQAMIAEVESQRFEDTHLEALRKRLFDDDDIPASMHLRGLDHRLSLAATRHNALAQVLSNIFLLWDLWCAWSLTRWRQAHGKQVADWLDILFEIEALACLATFAAEHPDYCWPDMVEGQPRFIAKSLGHPLLPSAVRVSNDLRLDADVPALMITGSNMSGKSTMLRSIGVAVVLARAGAPVCAESLELTPLRLASSMRVDDSLEQGASRFFMEVRQLKRVLDSLKDDEDPLLFLLDEVLHGTNSRERNIGAKAVIQHLVAQGALGVVSSHDLGLVELERLSDGRIQNFHFEDHIEDGAMCFDYRIKSGPVATSNALRLMNAVGIQLPNLTAN